MMPIYYWVLFNERGEFAMGGARNVDREGWPGALFTTEDSLLADIKRGAWSKPNYTLVVTRIKPEGSACVLRHVYEVQP